MQTERSSPSLVTQVGPRGEERVAAASVLKISANLDRGNAGRRGENEKKKKRHLPANRRSVKRKGWEKRSKSAGKNAIKRSKKAEMWSRGIKNSPAIR